MQKIIIGIDPGKGGGLAVSVGGVITEFHKYPTTQQDLYYTMHEILGKWNGKPLAYIEQVHAFPTDGRSSAFKFGTNYGIWKGLLLGMQIDYKLVAPQVWMKSLPLSKNKKERKNQLKEMAQGIINNQNNFNELKNKRVTLHTSDAILISGYGYLSETISEMNIGQYIKQLKKEK
tara:strand:+ start:132 stop:656 length:525 start_codon:yes stop_codon:yes gene_type:complete